MTRKVLRAWTSADWADTSDRYGLGLSREKRDADDAYVEIREVDATDAPADFSDVDQDLAAFARQVEEQRFTRADLVCALWNARVTIPQIELTAEIVDGD